MVRERAGFGGRAPEYLTKQSPRAFAISPDGHWGRAWTEQEPGKRPPRDDTKERALANCKRNAGTDCRLCAVNDQRFVPAPAASAAPAAAPTAVR
jgi:hypothetical protein